MYINIVYMYMYIHIVYMYMYSLASQPLRLEEEGSGDTVTHFVALRWNVSVPIRSFQSHGSNHMNAFVTWKSVTYEEKMDVDAMISEAVWKLGYEKVKEDQRYVSRKFVEGHDVFVSLPTGFRKSHIRDALAKETWQCSNCISQCNKVCYSVPRPFLLQVKGLARETSTCTPITETNSLLHYHSIFTHVSPFPLDDQFFIIFSGIPCVNIQIFTRVHIRNLYFRFRI